MSDNGSGPKVISFFVCLFVCLFVYHKKTLQ